MNSQFNFKIYQLILNQFYIPIRLDIFFCNNCCINLAIIQRTDHMLLHSSLA